MKLLKTLFPLLLITISALNANASTNIFGSGVQIYEDSLILTPADTISGDTLRRIDQPGNQEIRDAARDSLFKNITVIKAKKDKPITSKIRYAAKDSIVYDITGSEVRLYNGAEVYYEDIVLKADYIRIDQKNRTVYAQGLKDSLGTVKGKPVFTDNGQEFRSDEIAYNFETKKGKIKEVKTKEGDGFLLAEDVKRNQYEEIYIKDGKYTTCNLDHPHFYIGLTRAKNLKDRTVSGPAYLVVEDVPLPLAIPFGFFPRKNTRSSGILIPEIGEDNTLGFFLRNGGYYFGFSDYFDMQLRGDIYSKGSFGFSTTTRYNYRYHFNGNLNAGYLNRKEGEPETAGYIQSKEFFVRWMHSQDGKARPGTRFNANVNVASRNNYRTVPSSSIQTIVQNDLSSSISYSKYWIGTPFSLSTSLSHSQNLQTGIINLGLPKTNFSVATIYPLQSKNRVGKKRFYERIGTSYSLDAENRISTYDSILFTEQTLDKFQYGFRHSIPVSTSFNVLKFLIVTPSFNYTERWYFSSIEKSWDGSQVITDTIQGFKPARDYSTSVNMLTKLFGMYNVNALGIVAVRHVLTPNVSYTYKPDFSEGQYGYYKPYQVDSTGRIGKYSIFEQGIYGSPSAGESSTLGFGLSNNLEMKIRTENDTASATKKIAIFDNISVSSGYNFAMDSLNFSNISLSARTNVLQKLNIDFTASYDPYARVKDTTGGTVREIRVNKYEINENHRLGRLTSARLNVSTNLNAQALKKKKPAGEQSQVRKKYLQQDLDYVDQNPAYYVDWTIPWSLQVSYFLNYSYTNYTELVTQGINFRGDLNITPKWKIGFDSGYDITLKEVTPTSLNIYRDLHCWDLAINWIPFGTYQRYSVDLKVKASILQDLKLSRRRESYQEF